MNVKSKTQGEHNTVELVIEVDAKTFDDAINQVYKRECKRINVPGFRKGKAPRKMLEAMFGSSLFYEDAVNDLYPGAYREAVEQEKLEPMAYPKVEIMDMGKEGFTFKATVPVKPEVKLGTYKGITAPKAPVEITDEDVDHELAPYIQRATRLVAVKRKSKKGDTAVIDFEGFENGVPFEGGKGEGYSLELGSGNFVPGFEEGVIGMKAGEEKDIDLTFPEDYAPELAGKPVVFHVKVHEVKEQVKPTLDDEFAKDVSEFDTLADLRKDLGDKLRTRREEQAQKDFERAVNDQLIDGMEADLADAVVEQEADKMVEDYAARVQSQGIPFEQYLAMMGMNPQAFRAEAMVGARRRVLNELALEAVAKAEGLTVTDQEKEEECGRLAQEYSMELDAVKDAVSDKDLERDLLMKKAAQFVLDNAKVGKAPAKKAAKKASDEEAKSAKKTAAKKTTAKKASAEEGEEAKSAKKPAAKKTAKKTEE